MTCSTEYVLTENYVTGSKAPLLLEVVDYNNVPISLLSPKVKLIRTTDLYYYDYIDNAFKAPGAPGVEWTPLVELLPDLPGFYRAVFDQSIDNVNMIYEATYCLDGPCFFGTVGVTMVFGPPVHQVIPMIVVMKPPTLTMTLRNIFLTGTMTQPEKINAFASNLKLTASIKDYKLKAVIKCPQI